MDLKRLSLEQMENVQGDGTIACVASIIGTAAMLAGFFAVPVGGWAVGLYVANAILGPTVNGIGIISGCTSRGAEIL